MRNAAVAVVTLATAAHAGPVPAGWKVIKDNGPGIVDTIQGG